MSAREEELAALMRATLEGDARAYRALLESLSRYLRPVVRSACARVGMPQGDVEDMVQEVLLAVHLKRHTWDAEQRLGPWLNAIVRHKVIDGIRRRGRRDEAPIENFLEVLPAEQAEAPPSQAALERYTDALAGRQRDVVRSIGMQGATIGETAQRLNMSEGAVRVALHRGLANLARIYRTANS